VLGTGISFVLYYDLIAAIGPAKTALVAYVAPGFAVVYGVTLLDESFTATTAAGLVLILGGSWLAAEGRVPWRRRVPAPVAGEAQA
jgi:drug/metabolite transporter (DMT)-like permease